MFCLSVALMSHQLLSVGDSAPGLQGMGVKQGADRRRRTCFFGGGVVYFSMWLWGDTCSSPQQECLRGRLILQFGETAQPPRLCHHAHGYSWPTPLSPWNASSGFVLTTVESRSWFRGIDGMVEASFFVTTALARMLLRQPCSFLGGPEFSFAVPPPKSVQIPSLLTSPHSPRADSHPLYPFDS